VLPTRVLAELAVWTAGLEAVAEGALTGAGAEAGEEAGAEAGPVGLTTVAVLVLVLERVAVTFP
jgi:hypothetical protein